MFDCLFFHFYVSCRTAVHKQIPAYFRIFNVFESNSSKFSGDDFAVNTKSLIIDTVFHFAGRLIKSSGSYKTE